MAKALEVLISIYFFSLTNPDNIISLIRSFVYNKHHKLLRSSMYGVFRKTGAAIDLGSVLYTLLLYVYNEGI